MNLTLYPQPTRDVTLGSPDGAYFSIDGDRAQVTIVGPMLFTPRQYLDAVNDHVQKDAPDRYFEIDDIEVMKAPDSKDETLKKNVLHRGFFAIKMSAIP